MRTGCVFDDAVVLIPRQAAFTKLKKLLCDKWDFVFMQAEEQVR